MIKTFLMQLQFFTRLPVPANINFDEEKFSKNILLAPIVGLIIGGFMCLLFFLLNLTGKYLIAVLLIIIFEVIITGGLHLDGLADTFDGVFSNRPMEKILAIMRDPKIGTNGTLVLIFFFMLKTGFLLSIQYDNTLSYLLFMPVIGRMNMTVSAGISNYARKTRGLGETIIKNTGVKEMAIAVLISTIISIIILNIKGVIAIISGLLFTLAITKYFSKKLGGSTGDTLGAVVELSELFFLFSMIIYESIH